MITKFIRKFAVSAVILGGIAVFATQVEAQETVRLGNLKFAHYGAVSYIKEIAPKCGIKVDERVFPKGLDAMQAVIAGELDVAAVSSEAVISARASGTPIYLVAGFAKGGVRLVGRSDLPVKTVKDLKGKKVGVTRGGIQDILLAAELSQNGLTYSDQPGKDVQIIYLGFPDLNQALMGKNIDAMMQSEPYSSQAISKGFGKEIIKPYDTAIGEPVRTMVMTEKFYKEHRPLADKFMRQVSHEDFINAIENSPYTYDITAEHIQTTTDLMQKYGVGKMTKPPVAKDWVKTDLLDQAKKSLNIQ